MLFCFELRLSSRRWFNHDFLLVASWLCMYVQRQLSRLVRLNDFRKSKTLANDEKFTHTGNSNSNTVQCICVWEWARRVYEKRDEMKMWRMSYCTRMCVCVTGCVSVSFSHMDTVRTTSVVNGVLTWYRARTQRADFTVKFMCLSAQKSCLLVVCDQCR